MIVSSPSKVGPRLRELFLLRPGAHFLAQPLSADFSSYFLQETQVKMNMCHSFPFP